MDDDPLSPPFSTKVAVAVCDDLESWQRLNVTAFLVSGITAANPHLVGAPCADADGQQYLRLLGVPVLVFEGSAADLSAARGRTLDRGIPLAVYNGACSPPGTTPPTAPSWRRSPAPTSTLWASPYTARRTRSTRSSKALTCTRERERPTNDNAAQIA